MKAKPHLPALKQKSSPSFGFAASGGGFRLACITENVLKAASNRRCHSGLNSLLSPTNESSRDPQPSVMSWSSQIITAGSEHMTRR